MAKVLNYESQIGQSLVIQSWHVSQSVDAFTGADAFDITLSGSSTVTGSTNILASEGSNLTLEINESASFEFLTGAANSGSFIVQTSPDTGKGALQTFFGQGNATVGVANIPNQAFGVKYTSGSGASHGELTMTIGKRDLTNLGSTDLNNFFVAYEPAGILSNAEGELEFHLGDHFKVGNGIVLEYRGGNDPTAQTSSFAGYFSSSAFPNQQQYTRPFAISTLTQVNDSNPAFVVNKNIDHPSESKFSVDYGGNVVFNGNISGSGTNSSYFGDEYNAHGDDPNSGFTLLSLGSKPSFWTSGTSVFIGNAANSSQTGISLVGEVTASANISASGDVIGLSGSFADLSVSNLAAIGDNSTDTITINGNTTFTISEGANSIKIFEAALANDVLKFEATEEPLMLFAFDPTNMGNDDQSQGRIGLGVPTSSIDAKLHIRHKVGTGADAPQNLLRLDLDSTPSFRVSASSDIFASGSMTVQGGRPVTTHTTPLTNSLDNAGRYHIVGGNLTCSVQELPAVPTGAEFEFFQTSSAGQFLFETGSGTSILSKNGSLRLAQQGSSAVLKKVAGGTYHLMGDLT